MPDDVLVALRIQASSNVAAVAQRDELALREYGAQAEAMGAKSTAATAKLEQSAARGNAAAAEAARSVSTVGLAFGGVTAAIDVLSAKVAANYQRDMELVRTEAGASQAEVDLMSKSLMSLSGEVATGPEQLAQSLYHVESAGFRGAQALDIVKASAMGAKVGHADLQAVTQALIATTASHIQGIHGEVDAMSQLNAVVGSGDMRMQDLAQAMSTGILPAAAVAGLSFRDVGASLATLTDNAVPADEAATRLRMTISLMAAPSAAAQKALASVGLSATQLASDMRQPNGLLVAVEDLKAHLDGLSKVDQEAVLARAFGGGRSSSAIETLISQLDRLRSKYDEQAAAADRFGGAWTATKKTVAYQWDELTALFERLAIESGDVLLPALQVLGPALEDVGNGMESIQRSAPGLVTVLSAVGLSVGAISLALKVGMGLWAPYGALLSYVTGAGAGAAASGTAAAGGIAATGAAAEAATPPMTALAGFLGVVDTEMGGLAVAAPAASTALIAEGAAAGEAATGMGLMSGALDVLLGPVGLALLAGTLGVIAYEKSPAFRHEVDQAANHLKNDLDGAIYGTTEALKGMGTVLDTISAKLKNMPGMPNLPGGDLLKGLGLVATAPLTGPYVALDMLLQKIHQDHVANEQSLARQRDLAKGIADERAHWLLASPGGGALGNTGFGFISSAPPLSASGGRASRPESGPSSDPVKQKVDDLAKDLDKLHQHLQNVLNEAVAKRYYDVQAGAPPSVIAADSAAVRQAQKNLDEFNKATSTSTTAHQKHVAAIDRLTTDLEKIRTRLTTALNDAVARLVLDERTKGTPAATIAADQARVDSAKRSLDAFTKQVDDATRAVRESKGLPIQKQDQAQAQANYDAALKQAAKDIREHGAMTVVDKERLLGSASALAGFTDSTKKAQDWIDRQTHPKVLTASEQQTKDRASLQTAYDNAVALGAADLRAGHAITKAHQDAIDRDKAALDRFNRSITEAEGQNIKAAKATQALVDVLQQIPSAWQAAQQNLARLIVTGQAGQQARIGGPAGIEPGTMPTKGDIATLGLGRAATSQEGLNLANDQASTAANAAMLTAARSAGDLSRAFDILSQTDTANLSASWKALEEHFLTGDGNLQDLIASYQAAKAAQDQETQANIDALKATGQYAAARQAQQQADDAAFNDTLAKDIGILEQHGSVSQADIDALIRHRESADADTQANWDLSFAAASAAEQSAMLSQRFSGMVSQAQQQQGDLGRLDQASLSILTAQATVQTDKLSELVTETQDQTAIMAAQANVDKARGDGQVTALTDQTAILQASESVWKDTQDLMRATTPQAVAVARQQLAVDQLGVKLQQDKAAADARNAQMQVVLAQDNVTIQKDKAAADAAAAAAKMRQDEDTLQTAIDTQKLTEDEVTLDGIMAERLDTLVTSAIPDVKSRYGEIVGALGSIAQDNAAIRADNRQSAMDQIQASQQAQAYALQISQDEQQLAADQSSANAQSLAGQLQQGQDAYALEQAKFGLQQLQYAEAQAQTGLLANLPAYLAATNNMLHELKQLVTSNAFVQRFGLAGSRGLNQLTVDMHGSVSA